MSHYKIGDKVTIRIENKSRYAAPFGDRLNGLSGVIVRDDGREDFGSGKYLVEFDNDLFVSEEQHNPYKNFWFPAEELRHNNEIDTIPQ